LQWQHVITICNKFWLEFDGSVNDCNTRQIRRNIFRWQHWWQFWNTMAKFLLSRAMPQQSANDHVPRQTECFTITRIQIHLPSNRHHRSNGDCLESKRENYQVCSVQYSAQQLCTVQCTHIWTDLTVLWIGNSLNGPTSLCLARFIFMAALCNRAGHYILPCGFFFLSSFFLA